MEGDGAMRETIMKKIALLSASLSCALGTSTAFAVQYPFLDPSYTQEIYTGPLVGGPGMAWTNSGALLTRDGSNIYEYSMTQNTTHMGTNVHGYTTHSISGLSTTGYGMTNGLDGYIYTTTNTGLERFNPNNWAAPAQSLSGTVGGQGYGIHVMADGKIAYVAGAGTNEVYMYDPVAATNTLIYTASALIDDIASDPSGYIVLAGQVNSDLTVITSGGTFVNSWSAAHFPDGLAFGDGINNNKIFANNNDGTITEYTFGAGYLGVPSVNDIATGSQAYGDLAEVGPDCAFYVTQFDNGGYHGCTAGVGTHWDNGTTNNEASIIRISLRNGDCGFYHPFETVPEPTSMAAIGLGLGCLLRRRRARN